MQASLFRSNREQDAQAKQSHTLSSLKTASHNQEPPLRTESSHCQEQQATTIPLPLPKEPTHGEVVKEKRNKGVGEDKARGTASAVALNRQRPPGPTPSRQRGPEAPKGARRAPSHHCQHHRRGRGHCHSISRSTKPNKVNNHPCTAVILP